MTRSDTTSRPRSGQMNDYWERTRWPLQSFYFLLPLMVIYELGTLYVSPDPSRRIWAERLIGMVAERIGVAGYYLPGILLLVVLLCMHFVRRDPSKPEPLMYVMMLAESAMLSIPLFVLAWVLASQPINVPTPDQVVAPVEAGRMVLLAGADSANEIHSWGENATISIGAGIYEELLFRLIGIAVLHLLLVDLLALPDHYGSLLAVAGTAVAFALYHFDSLQFWDWPSDEWSRFAFLTIAGVYFAAVYLLRGFGIVVMAHAFYDILVGSVILWQQGSS